MLAFEDLGVFQIFYHIFPFSYYVRSALFMSFGYSTFESCEPGTLSAVCVQEEQPGVGVPGTTILDVFSSVFTIASSEDTTARDTLLLIAIGCVWKVIYAAGVIIKTRQVAVIAEPSSISTKQVETPGQPASSVTAKSSGKVDYIPYSYPLQVPRDLTDEVSV